MSLKTKQPSELQGIRGIAHMDSDVLRTLSKKSESVELLVLCVETSKKTIYDMHTSQKLALDYINYYL